jgi:hypothetical protein
VKTSQYIWALCMVIIATVACNKTKVEGGVDDRLFRPVLKGGLVSEGNWISVNLQKISGAVSYVVQVSRDTFKTIDRTITTSKDTAYFDNLLWERLYQVRAKAVASDTVKNSKIADFGSIKTARFPTILNIPTLAEVTDAAVKVSWTNGGAAVTSVKILKASDSSVVTTVTLTATDITNQYRIVSGLASSTDYIIYLYSGTSVRGWADFKTSAPLTGTVIDLREITGRPSVLADTIPIIPDGATVLLKRGQQYNIASAVSLGKSITIRSGSDLIVPDQAFIFFTSNFNFVAGANIGYIDFKDVSMKSDAYGSRYIFNTTNGATVGRVSFEDCKAEIFRGIMRLQSGTTSVTNFIVNKCIIDSISNYGILTVDNITCKADNITIQNSTIYKAERVVTSRSNSVTVLIENCSMNEVVSTGSYLVAYSTSPTNNVSNGIKVNNCIFGVGKATGTVRGVQSGATTAVEANNNYKTLDYVGIAPELPGLLSYPGNATALWVDPINGNFRIKDNSFAGKANTGDPKWRL